MWESGGQFVYHGTPGSVCRSENNGSVMWSPPARESMIQKVAKYGMGKQSVRVVI
jgi:hypothetical protein